MITAVAALKGEPETVYAGSSNGGLFRSTNANTSNPTWQNLTDLDRIPGAGIGDILIDPNINSGGLYHNIYIAYGAQRWNYYGIGVFKSIDNGVHWTETDLNISNFSGSPPYVNVVKFLQPSSSKILAMTNNDLFETTDEGVNWPSLNFISQASLYLKDLERDLTNPDNIYISGGITGGDQIWKRDDALNSWERLDNVSSFFIPPPPAGYLLKYKSISLSGISCGCMAIIKFEYTNGSLQYRIEKYDESTDLWTVINTPNTWAPIFIVSPSLSNVMYLGDTPYPGRSVAKSIDGGQNFYNVNNYNPLIFYNGVSTHADLRALKLIASSSTNGTGDNDFMIAGNDGGVLYSNSATVLPPNTPKVNWNNIDGYGLNISQLNGIGGVESEEGFVAAGTQDNGNFLYRNGTCYSDMLCDAYDCIILPPDNTIVYSGKACSSNSFEIVNKSINGGISYLPNLTQATETRGGIRPIRYNRRNGKYYIAYHNVFQSSTPTLILNTTTAKISTFSSSPHNVQDCITINAMDVNEICPDTIYIGFDIPTWGLDLSNCPTCGSICTCSTSPCPLRKRLFKTIDGGQNWVDMTDVGYDQVDDLKGCRNNGITSLIMNPDDANEVYVTFKGYSTDNRVMRTLDGGTTWSDYSTGLREFPVNCIAFRRGSNEIYIGTDIGVFYRKTDVPNSQWECFNHSLPISAVTDLEINYCSQKILASTYGRGLWESNLPAQSAIAIGGIESWPDPRFIQSDIIILNNSKLTISSEVEFLKDKKIIVKQGGTLEVAFGYLHNYCGDMWHGIVVEPGGTVKIDTTSIIENAEYGIYAQSTSLEQTTIKVKHTEFRSNYKGIFIEENNSGYNNITFQAFDNHFTCPHNLIGSANINPLGTKTFAGIELNDMNCSIGKKYKSPNFFEGINAGIISHRSVLSLYSYRFKDIHKDPVYLSSNNLDGTSVFADGNAVIYLLDADGLYTPGNFTMFEGCDYGFQSYGVPVLLQRNTMNNVKGGIFLANLPNGSTSEVYLNNINCIERGIENFFCDFIHRLSIGLNTINVDNPDPIVIGTGVGIGDYDFNIPKEVYITDNTISVNNGNTAIQAIGATFHQIRNNTVDLTTFNLNVFAGISLEACDRNIVDCNHVNGSSSSAHQDLAQYGYHFALSPGNSVFCNEAFTISKGFVFKGNCRMPNQFGGNKMGSDYRSLS